MNNGTPWPGKNQRDLYLYPYNYKGKSTKWAKEDPNGTRGTENTSRKTKEGGHITSMNHAIGKIINTAAGDPAW